MTRLKTDMLVGAAIRRAGAELIDCVMLRRGHADAGAILVHIDALDGRHMLLARSLEFDGSYVWRPVIGGPDGDGWAARDVVEARLAREMDIDPAAFVLAVQVRLGRIPFDRV